MYPEDTMPRGEALGAAWTEADRALVGRLLAHFQPPPTQSWVWLTTPAVRDAPRTTHLFAYNSITEKGEHAPVRGVMPPDCPPCPWAGWGLLYPDHASTPFGP